MMRLLSLSTCVAAVHAVHEISIAKQPNSSGPSGLYRRNGRLVRRSVGTNFFEPLVGGYGDVYYTNVTVGTPPQIQTVFVSTGSSDFYFDASNASTCQLPSTNINSCRDGTFNLSLSSTYRQLAASPAFNITFSDGSGAVGPYGSDVVGIGNVLISGVQFGVGEMVNGNGGTYNLGLMGIGYSDREAVSSTSQFYPNVPEMLVRSGQAITRLYSIYLGSRASTGSGSILFGALDTSRYIGNLTTINLLPALTRASFATVIDQFIIPITAINLTTSTNHTNIFNSSGNPSNATQYYTQSLPVLLESASTDWSMPSRVYNSILSGFPYVNASTRNCLCSDVDNRAYLTVTFDQRSIINISAIELFTPQFDTHGQPTNYTFNGRTGSLCTLSIDSDDQPYNGQGDEYWIMGTAGMTSMYAVFDLDNAQLSLAQAAVNATGPSNPIAVPSGTAGVFSAGVNVVTASNTNTYSRAPSITTGTPQYRVSNAASPVGTATGLAALPVDARISIANPLSSLSPTNTNPPTSTPAPGPSHAGAIAGGVVGGIAGLALIVGGAYFLLRRRRRKAKSDEPVREMQTDDMASPGTDGDTIFSASPRLGDK